MAEEGGASMRRFDTKDEAVRFVLAVLRRPLMLMCAPDRRSAEEAVELHEISVADLIAAGLKQARGA